MFKPFHWLENATVSIAATTSSANVKLLRPPTGSFQLRVFNSGTTPIAIRKGVDNTVAALVTDMPIAPGATEVLTLNNSETAPITHIAAIALSGAGTIYFTTGAGI